ncbi:hypothetical protein CDD82_1501 [Ophiocordyceps australis]|uniref:Uncharacterized protein n=1 Tax=Ophiocordyceps australis TaxID=1399860 RepID=A0A2C5YHM5_9HYPO|nr:hypothetical protein CDD82_1501 [Ophiocordyceps australis]
MDPTTTLITFLLQTDPTVQTVELIGSWDNFSSCYAMKRDVRRGQGQWRGCYSFKNIVCDDNNALKRTKRNGGLKMGATYYYYYEIDGSIETYDSAEPWTTSCPYLPGQAVNTLIVPVEHSFRKRSASLNSMREESFRTMDPNAKFTKPQPLPTLMAETSRRRLDTATPIFHTRPALCPPSPISLWRRLFGRRQSNQTPTPTRDAQTKLAPPTEMDQMRGLTSSDCSISGLPSCEPMQQLPSQHIAGALQPRCSREPVLSIPEDIVEEVHDQVPSLGPAAPQRAGQAASLPHNSAQVEGFGSAKTVSKVACSPSISSSILTSSVSPTLGEDEPPSFYDSNDDDEVLSSNDGDNYPHQSLPSLCAPGYGFAGYSLPRQTDYTKGMTSSPPMQAFGSPRLVARNEATVPMSGTNLLATTIDSDLDDFVHEMGWMVGVIGNKQA